MAVKIWFVFLFSATFISLSKCKNNTSMPKPTTASNLKPEAKVIVEGNYNEVYLCHDKEIKTALALIQKKLDSLEEKVNAVMGKKENLPACKFDFEDGIFDWKKTGTAFNNQPTYGDNSAARKSHPANHQGNWWIGSYESRSNKVASAGGTQGDGPQGTLTSPPFKITGKHISFLIGGGCDMKTIRAELIVDHKVVRTATGKCSETMTRKVWDVQAFIGRHARVKLIDFNSSGWGHINFDDLKGDISCDQV